MPLNSPTCDNTGESTESPTARLAITAVMAPTFLFMMGWSFCLMAPLALMNSLSGRSRDER